MSDSDYFKEFKDKASTVEQIGGCIGDSFDMVMAELKKDGVDAIAHLKSKGVTDEQIAKARQTARDKYLAVMFLINADSGRYAPLVNDIVNRYTASLDTYPLTLNAAYDYVTNYRGRRNPVHSEGVAFYTEGGEEPSGRGAGRSSSGRGGRGGRGRGRGSGRSGNRSNGQPEIAADNSSDDAQFLMDSVTDEAGSDNFNTAVQDYSRFETCLQVMNQRGEKHADLRSLLLIDSCSTVCIISNATMLERIFESGDQVHVRCNAGVRSTSMKGYLDGFPEAVWYDPDGVANILSMYIVKKYFRVTYDSDAQDEIVVARRDGGATSVFRPTAKGLYACDGHQALPGDNQHEWTMITTVKQNRAKYSRRACQDAARARRAQNIMMFPSARQYADITERGLIKNCPITRRDIVVAEDILGTNLGALKGKTPRTATPHVSGHVEPVPPAILDIYQDVTLAIDIMFVNKVAFFVSISRMLHFGTVESLENRQIPTIQRAMSKILSLYRRRGFKVRIVMADGEFAPLENLFPAVQFNLCANDEHVPEVERYIRTIKDRARCGYNLLPFERVPRLILIRLIYNATFWLNAFPHRDGVSDHLSPRYLLTGRHLDYNTHVRAEFGSYVQTHEEHTNDMNARTIGAICLGPTGNDQGGHFFMSLSTGAKIRREHWTPLPMPDDVIRRITHLGTQQGMPRTLTFGNRYGAEIHDQHSDVDDDHDTDYNPDDDASTSSADTFGSAASDTSTSAAPDHGPLDSDASSDTSVASAGVDDAPLIAIDEDGSSDGGSTHSDSNDYPQDGSSHEPYHDEAGHNQQDHETPNNSDDESQANAPAVDPFGPQDDPQPDPELLAEQAPAEPPQIAGVGDENAGVGNDMAGGEDDINQQMDERYGPRNHQYQLRERRPRSFSHLFFGAEDPMGMMFLTEQMSLKKGLKTFGKDGAEAVVAELKQLHYCRTIKPVMASKMTREHKRAALRYLMFLKQKRCGRIKARGCADGRKQRIYKSKEETSLPTAHTESLFLTSAIDAREGRAVVTLDIPGAFMHADIDELIHVRLDGPMCDLLVRVDPSHYGPFVTKEHGTNVIYVQLTKALYGTLQAALLFWENLSAFLVDELGFKVNPYDRCVANKIIDGKQCTVLWHVDDIKMSHMDQAVLDDLAARINDRYGKEKPVTVTRGKIHEYLGMTLDFSVPGKVTFRMDDYIQGLLEEMPADMSGTASTPAAAFLFDVNDKAEKLDPKKADNYHHLTAKALYLCKRVRPDLQTAVAFLSTRVAAPDVDDWKKLGRCLRYLRGSKEIPLTLEIGDEGVIKWYVDASFAVHRDMRSHTGATVTMGGGSSYSMSTKQKLNTKSSTEAELVGVDDAMPLIIWTRNFLLAQGFTVVDNVVYQDNQSAILLERNGKASSGRRTRHIEIRYFFVTDRVKKGEVSVQYCPTGDMIGDFFTKPLQGSQFKKLRAAILNIPADVPLPITTRGTQECVGSKSYLMAARSSESVVPPATSADSKCSKPASAVKAG